MQRAASPWLVRLGTCHLMVVVVVVGMGVVAAGDTEFVYDGAGLALDGMATVTPVGLLQLTNDTTMPKGHGLPPAPRHVPASYGNRRHCFRGGVLIVDHLRVRHHVRVPGPEHERVRVPGGANQIPVHGPRPCRSSTWACSTTPTNGDSNNHVLAYSVRNPEFADINNNHVSIDVNCAVDARLGSGYDAAEADLVLWLACLHPLPAARPSMRQRQRPLFDSSSFPSDHAGPISLSSGR